MCDFLQKCRELGLGSRIVESKIGLSILEVSEIGGDSLKEFNQLNQKEEAGIDKWLKLAKGREYDGDEVILELVAEVYKKLERIEEHLFAHRSNLLPLTQNVQTCCIGHEALCFDQALCEGKIYYARMDLPVFPNKLIPFYFKMLTPHIAQIVKMGDLHTRSYDSYVVECERIGIRVKRQEEKQ